MTSAFRIVTGCAIVMFGTLLAIAQEQDAKPAAAKKAKPAAAKPAATPDAKPEAKPADETPENPAVTALLESNPKTPLDCLRTAKALVDFDREDLARQFLKKVIDAKLSASQLASLGEQMNTAAIMDFGARRKLQPEGKQIADAVMAAVEVKRKDADRIAKLIRQLQDASPDKRFEAVAGLQESRDAAINPLLQVLADPKRTAEQANVRAALAELGEIVRVPLAAVVEQADPALASQAITVLGSLKDARVDLCLLTPCWSDKSDPVMREAAAAALKRLTGRVATRNEAIWLLSDAAKDFFERHNLNENDAKRELWRWDASKKQCELMVCPPETVARARTARLALDAYELSPDDPQMRTLYLATMLEMAAYENGIDRPLDPKNPASVELKRFDVKTLETVLRYCMAFDHPAAAAVAVQQLGQIGKPDELLYPQQGVSPLIVAVQSPYRRLQLAAAEAIVHMQPTKPFPGASYVVRTLGFFAASRGIRTALIACPYWADVQSLSAMLAVAGYETNASTSGRELLNQALQSPDCEFAIIDVGIARPEINELLQQLRHDPRTSQLRVAVIARTGFYAKAEREAERDPMAKAFPRPHDQKSLDWQLNQLMAIAPDNFVNAKLRQQEAAQALDLLAILNQLPDNGFYDIRGIQESLLVALRNPKLSEKASLVLASINSPDVQRALVNQASRAAMPLRVRLAAARAFRLNTQKFGILLTTDEIKRQYNRYNASETQDEGTQRILGQILDCLEINVPKKKSGV